MDIRKYITKKNVIIGGIVALIVRYHKKKEIKRILKMYRKVSDTTGQIYYDCIL